MPSTTNRKYRFATIAELRAECTCPSDPEDGMCETCQIIGALHAGIPRSVVFGEKKLSEVFSENYIDHMCNRSPRNEVE